MIPATAVAAGIGVQLAGLVENLQGALRRQLLTLFKWLAPLAALIVGLFSIALLMKSGALFVHGRSAIEAGWLLALVIANIYLLNAAYEDGSGEAPYPRLLGTLVRLGVPLLAAIAILATWALGLRIADYGLTVPRVWGLLVALIALSYSLGYAWAAFRPGAWMARMGAVNVCVALGTAAVLAFMLTPVLSPSRLVAPARRHASWPAIRALKTASSSWASSRTGTVARASSVWPRAHRGPMPPTCATAPRPRSRRRPSGNYAPSRVRR